MIEQQTGVPASVFATTAESGRYALPPYLPKGRSTEGFLFPDTYEFVRKGLDADAIIHRMLEQFDTEATDLDLTAGAKALGLTPYQVVIVASMIEREAQVEQDRATIAGVIYNRLDAGQTLGIDATLLYDDPTPDGKLSTADLAAASPYNTRINAGLPPTPIASPGRASLEAALHPEQTDYFYYVLCPPDGSGVHGSRSPTTSIWPTFASASVDERHRIGGSTHLAGVIGWPIDHSLSPVIHNAAYEALGLDWVYVPSRCAQGAVGAALAGLPALGFAGANVTMPHKETWPASEVLSDDAALPARGQHDRRHADGARRAQHGRAGVRTLPRARRGVRCGGHERARVRRRGRRSRMRAGDRPGGRGPDRGRPAGPGARVRADRDVGRPRDRGRVVSFAEAPGAAAT